MPKQHRMDFSNRGRDLPPLKRSTTYQRMPSIGSHLHAKSTIQAPSQWTLVHPNPFASMSRRSSQRTPTDAKATPYRIAERHPDKPATLITDPVANHKLTFRTDPSNSANTHSPTAVDIDHLRIGKKKGRRNQSAPNSIIDPQRSHSSSQAADARNDKALGLVHASAVYNTCQTENSEDCHRGRLRNHTVDIEVVDQHVRCTSVKRTASERESHRVGKQLR